MKKYDRNKKEERPKHYKKSKPKPFIIQCRFVGEDILINALGRRYYDGIKRWHTYKKYAKIEDRDRAFETVTRKERSNKWQYRKLDIPTVSQ